MTTIKALELDDHLPQAGQAPVCLLVGGDEALRARSLSLLRSAAAPPDQPGSTVLELDETPEARQVFDELRTIPFLGLEGRRVVVVRNGDAFLRGHADRLTAYLAKPSATSTLILCLDEMPTTGKATRKGDSTQTAPDAKKKAKADGVRKVVKALRAKGLIVDCGRLSWADARRWLQSHAAACGLKLTPRAVSALVEAVGPNVVALEAEVTKLSAYCSPNGTASERDVGEVVAAGRSRSVFDLSNAVMGGDAAEALRLCNRLLLRGESRDGIIALLGRQVRRLWQVKRLKDGGASERDIARQMGMHDFAVRQSLRQLPGLSDGWFARQLRDLSAADYESKATSLRAAESKGWLENLLVKMCKR